VLCRFSEDVVGEVDVLCADGLLDRPVALQFVDIVECVDVVGEFTGAGELALGGRIAEIFDGEFGSSADSHDSRVTNL